ncbi:AzlD domain-containing protein [Microcella indica]|jgi:hypothetical protein|uniref:AzlD domain-containing protein n=1 Tax=Microcella indica TaxID=2750620 RepID=UPI0015CF3546|nr:AzlD domain-containing protein [Microcella indica]
MTLWQIILLASIAVLALKLVGYLVPPRVLETPTAARTANLTTVALLSALIVVQTVSAGQQLVLDARLPALVVAAGLLAVRAPFILVILAAALAAALLRMLGWAA